MPQRLLLTSPARLLALLACLLVLFSLAGPAQAEPAAATAAIGQVSFVVGEAQLERAGKRQALRLDETLAEGDRIITGPDGLVHLRMSDQGFIAVRPGSRLELRRYHYAPATPADNRVLLHLETGSVRTVSGTAGEVNREQYRFTTPIAAIGLRGTDYVVHSEAELTRVSVLKGAIVMNPLGPGCSADLASSCQTPWMRELAAGNPNAWLELRIHGDSPQIKLRQDINLPQTPRDDSPTKAEKEVLNVLQDSAATIVWGRWSHVATTTPRLIDQLTDQRRITFANELFGLLQPKADPGLRRGSVDMKYNVGEAWLKNADGLQQASVESGELHIDFDQRAFNTRLKANLPDSYKSLHSSGQLTGKGELISTPGAGNMQVQGVVGHNAHEAGYLFEAGIGDATLYGATHWRR